MKKKLTVGLSTFLCLIVLFAALPMTAFADNVLIFYYMNENEDNYPVANFSTYKWKVGDKTDVIYDEMYKMFNDPGWAEDINIDLGYPEDTDLNSAELTIYAKGGLLQNGKLLQRGIDCVEFFGGEGSVDVYVIVKLPCTHPSDKITHHNPKDANCTEDGNEEYWECTKCGKLFSDADCKNATSSANVTRTKLGHHVKDGSSVAKLPADGCLNGCRAYYECDRCNNYIDSDNKVIGDAAALATWKITKNKGLIAGNPDSHRSTAVVTVPGKDATCEEDGFKGCVVCKNCGKYAELVSGTGDYVTLKDIIGDETAYNAWKADSTKGFIEKLGHDYPDTWEQESGNDTQHKRVCANDPTHIEYADHTFGAGTLKTRADDGAEGEYVCECSACSYVKSEKFSYKVTKGEGSTYTLGSKEDLTITANGEFSKFEKLQIDGADLDAANYTAESGSTIVTLKNAYLETLKAGTYTIKYIYSDGSCSGTFIIAKKSGGSTGGQPGTGYDNHIVLWINLIALSAAALAWALIWLRKRGLLFAAVPAGEKAISADEPAEDEPKTEE